MLIDTSVFSTILVNSSKLILPSRSKSASMMVLSTIYRGISFHKRHEKRLVHLLELLILQITSHHHLQNNEEFTIADVPIAVDVVYAERESQLLLFIAFATEC